MVVDYSFSLNSRRVGNTENKINKPPSVETDGGRPKPKPFQLGVPRVRDTLPPLLHSLSILWTLCST